MIERIEITGKSVRDMSLTEKSVTQVEVQDAFDKTYSDIEEIQDDAELAKNTALSILDIQKQTEIKLNELDESVISAKTDIENLNQSLNDIDISVENLISTTEEIKAKLEETNLSVISALTVSDAAKATADEAKAESVSAIEAVEQAKTDIQLATAATIENKNSINSINTQLVQQNTAINYLNIADTAHNASINAIQTVNTVQDEKIAELSKNISDWQHALEGVTMSDGQSYGIVRRILGLVITALGGKVVKSTSIRIEITDDDITNGTATVMLEIPVKSDSGKDIDVQWE